MSILAHPVSWDEYLSDAIDAGEMAHIQAALENGADPNASEGYPKWSLLCSAVAKRSIEMVKLLLAHGATVASEQNNDYHSLLAAVENNDLPMVDLLLEADGAVALDWYDDISYTPLMCAVRDDFSMMAIRLLKAGADVNANEESRIGSTALAVAVDRIDLKMVELLLKAGANPTIPGWMQLTPLDRAQRLKRGDGPQILALLEHAALKFRR